MRTVLDSLQLTEIFIACNDFYKHFQHCSMGQIHQLIKARQICEGEMMSMLIFYHLDGGYRGEALVAHMLTTYGDGSGK